MTTTAKALAAATAYDKRWTPGRKNRALDDRDFLLAEAIQKVEEFSASIYPAVTSLSAALAGLARSALTGLTITGTNFVGDAVNASGVSDEGSATKEITWTRVVPGDEDITVTIASSGVANHTVTGAWDAGTKVLTITRGTLATAAEVVTAVGTDAAAKFIVTVEATGDGTGVPTAGSTFITGGVGEVLTLSIGATAIDGSTAGNGITAVSDTSIVFCYDASAKTAGSAQLLQLRCDGVLVASIDLVVAGAIASSALGVQMCTVTLTAGAEGAGAANAVDVVVNLVDLEGNAVSRAQRLLVEVYGADMLIGGVAGTNLRLSEVGAGSEVSTTGKGTMIMDTDANGDATIRVTDNSGALAAAVWLKVTPISGTSILPGFPRIITFNFA